MITGLLSHPARSLKVALGDPGTDGGIELDPTLRTTNTPNNYANRENKCPSK